MDKITRYSSYLLWGMFCLSAPAWASYQPVSGSTVAIYATNNNTTAIPVTVQGLNSVSTTTVVNSTVGVVNLPGSSSLGQVNIVSTNTLNVSQQGAITVQGLNSVSTMSVVASTVGVQGVIADSSSFTLGTSPVFPIGATFDQFPTAVQSTTTAGLRMTPLRSLFVTPMDNSGVILGTSTTNPLVVQVQGLNSVSTVTVVNSTIAVTNAGQNPLVVFLSTVQVVNSTIGVVGSLSATTTAIDTATFNQAFPGIGAAVGGVNPSGGMQAFSVNSSSALVVTMSTVQVVSSTIGITNSGLSAITVSLSTVQVFNSTVSVSVQVTSTTIPTAQSDGKMINMMSDNVGRPAVTGMPWGLIKSSYTAFISSITGTGTGGEKVLVSSAGAATYTYICDCVFTSTGTIASTPTNGFIKLESPYNTPSNTVSVGLGVGGTTTLGYMGCVDPIFRSAPNSNIYLFQTINGAQEQVDTRCRYFQGP